jgi:curved DNA-binding protein CbpA
MSHYDVLGVGPAADESALHEAYVALARLHHPDLTGGDAGRMQAINEAWATLSDPVRRARYDRSLGGGSGHDSRPSGPVADDREADDLGDLDDLDDDAPVRITVALPRWLSLLPVATFAASVVLFSVSLTTSSRQLLGFALMLFVLSCVFFLAAPFVALFSSRRPNGEGGGEVGR